MLRSAGTRQHPMLRQQDSAAPSILSAAEQAAAFRAECAASDMSLGALTVAIITVLQLLAAAWLLAQYLLQVRFAGSLSWDFHARFPVIAELSPLAVCCTLLCYELSGGHCFSYAWFCSSIAVFFT